MAGLLTASNQMYFPSYLNVHDADAVMLSIFAASNGSVSIKDSQTGIYYALSVALTAGQVLYIMLTRDANSAAIRSGGLTGVTMLGGLIVFESGPADFVIRALIWRASGS